MQLEPKAGQGGLTQYIDEKILSFPTLKQMTLITEDLSQVAAMNLLLPVSIVENTNMLFQRRIIRLILFHSMLSYL